MRGKLQLIEQSQSTGRIIPARAGQTPSGIADSSHRADHPRACGANIHDGHNASTVAGSSPRVRGKRYWKGRPSRHRRIIPARAGQTVTGVSIRSPPPDHPRACGANCTRTVSHASRTGSSPRVRGKLPTFAYRAFHRRIIPARAGQTSRTQGHRRSAPDHPRACGANPRPVEASSSLIGSSPRVRGKLHVPTAGCGVRRIIPARAGQTPDPDAWSWLRPDHPRACGANVDHLACVPFPAGSSPRVRGKHSICARPVSRTRIIPARAGQTTPSHAPAGSGTDHPRACGANRSLPSLSTPGSGSSPRVRGKRGRAHAGDCLIRIIPARAGQTYRVVHQERA